MEWIYEINGKKAKLRTPPLGAVGFVYIIVFADGQKYIGKKNFWTNRKRRFGKREIAKLKDKRKKKYEIVTKESNWEEYTSSNPEVNVLIERGYKYKKRILRICKGKKELSYYEEKYLFMNGAIESDDYLNGNIAGRYYKRDLDGSRQKNRDK